ncbi:MAG TPA: hypothetical protein VHE53_05365 [Patescibacteria group bacterium]|nr:hypothetical protein [Patescibacteria group bacterium]
MGERIQIAYDKKSIVQVKDGVGVLTREAYREQALDSMLDTGQVHLRRELIAVGNSFYPHDIDPYYFGASFAWNATPLDMRANTIRDEYVIDAGKITQKTFSPRRAPIINYSDINYRVGMDLFPLLEGVRSAMGDDLRNQIVAMGGAFMIAYPLISAKMDMLAREGIISTNR